MNISGATSCFPNNIPQMYPVGAVDIVSASSLDANSVPGTQSSSLLFNLSVLKEKVHQVQSLVTILVSPDQSHQPESTSLAIANMGSLVQEIIVTASSMLFTCQQISLGSTAGNNNNNTNELHQNGLSHSEANFSDNCVGNIAQDGGQCLYSGETIDWYGDNNCNSRNAKQNMHVSSTPIKVETRKELARRSEISEGLRAVSNSSKNYDIIELDAADLLAKYTHYCQVCGKGFKRDANLRMHMRAHGDEYKTSAALTNPLKKNNNNQSGMGENNECSTKLPKKYSCPQEGCRWNQRHAKFQPLKSMICVKNHYKRSHCPKMYVCKRCNRKQFSVLSDLRTHEKHCGDLKWQCSCGTTFSRKDKLMGHVALFVGHIPAITTTTKQPGKQEHQATQLMQLDRG